MSAAYIAAGSTIAYKYGSASTYTPVAFVLTITPPEPTYGEAETTTLTSTAKTFLPTILEAGEVSFTVQHVTADASIAFCEAQVTTGPPAIGSWKITYKDTGTDVFNAFVKSYAAQEAEVEVVQEAQVTLKITGVIVNTPGV